LIFQIRSEIFVFKISFEEAICKTARIIFASEKSFKKNYDFFLRGFFGKKIFQKKACKIKTCVKTTA